MEHKCLITRVLRSAGRGRLSRNTSVVGGLWIFFPLFSRFIASLDLFCSSGGPRTPSSLFEEDSCRMGVYKQINFLRQQCTSLSPSAVCVHLIACPPRRHALVKATMASLPFSCLFPSIPPTLPLFSAVALCVSWQRTVSVGGLAWPPFSHVFCLPTAPLQIPLLRLFLPFWSSRSLPPHQQLVNKPPPGVGAWSWPCVVTHCPVWDPYHWHMRHGCVYVSYMGDSSSATCGLVFFWLRRSLYVMVK